MNNSIMELAWLFCKRAKEKGMNEDDIRWVLNRVLVYRQLSSVG
jgi:hypothetical protein